MKCRKCGRVFESDEASPACIDDVLDQIREAWGDIKKRLVWLRDSDDGVAFTHMDALLASTSEATS